MKTFKCSECGAPVDQTGPLMVCGYCGTSMGWDKYEPPAIPGFNTQNFTVALWLNRETPLYTFEYVPNKTFLPIFMEIPIEGGELQREACHTKTLLVVRCGSGKEPHIHNLWGIRPAHSSELVDTKLGVFVLDGVDVYANECALWDKVIKFADSHTGKPLWLWRFDIESEQGLVTLARDWNQMEIAQQLQEIHKQLLEGN